ncbi:hypothetical protein WA158_001085 [Blastocystis sp. Blastoise]
MSVEHSKKHYVIALTGGICSGKSTASRILQEQGCETIDCDKLGHEAYKPGSVGFKRVVETFGQRIVKEDGTINRPVLGSIVFGDEKELEKLNQIVQPIIHDLCLERINESSSEICVVEAAILLEAKWQDLADEIWVVSIPTEVAIEPIERLNSQWSNEQREQFATKVFYNINQKEFEEQVLTCFHEVQNKLIKSNN